MPSSKLQKLLRRSWEFPCSSLCSFYFFYWGGWGESPLPCCWSATAASLSLLLPSSAARHQILFSFLTISGWRSLYLSTGNAWEREGEWGEEPLWWPSSSSFHSGNILVVPNTFFYSFIFLFTSMSLWKLHLIAEIFCLFVCFLNWEVHEFEILPKAKTSHHTISIYLTLQQVVWILSPTRGSCEVRYGRNFLPSQWPHQ